MIDKKIIAERKAIYGDNFASIAEEWSDYIDDRNYILKGRDISKLMALMKQCRINAIDKKLVEFPTPDIGIKLYKAREDSVIDKANYEWIAENYEEYKKL